MKHKQKKKKMKQKHIPHKVGTCLVGPKKVWHHQLIPFMEEEDRHSENVLLQWVSPYKIRVLIC